MTVNLLMFRESAIFSMHIPCSILMSLQKSATSENEKYQCDVTYTSQWYSLLPSLYHSTNQADPATTLQLSWTGRWSGPVYSTQRPLRVNAGISNSHKSVESYNVKDWGTHFCSFLSYNYKQKHCRLNFKQAKKYGKKKVTKKLTNKKLYSFIMWKAIDLFAISCFWCLKCTIL
jgi:hypothetical protein